jgi:cytochrome c oxidase accessory protein FixG
MGQAPQPLPKFAFEELGDCIDCTICVQVCPTGIDIRNGLQYECIACGACIDACDEVMDKMGYPHGLIRYTTQNAIDGRPTRVLRPRVLVYGAILVALTAGWAWGVTGRSPLIAEVLRDRNALYRAAGDGNIENGYMLKLVNKDRQAHAYRIRIESDVAGIALCDQGRKVHAQAEQVLSLPLVVTAPAGVKGRHALRFHVETSDGAGVDGARETVDSSFFGPM